MAVSTLTIDMNARLASFERDLGRSVAIAKRNADQLEKSFHGVSTVLKSLGTVIGIRQIVQMGQALVGAAADLDDLAEKTGASVESLSKLQQVARNTGIPISDVEELVIRFNKALAGSDDEAKGAALALEQLGLQASELRGLDRAEAVIKFARALDQFTDSGGKADVILAILKRGGEQYAPLLKEIAQAGQLVATTTTDQAAEAEKFQKQMAALGEAIRGAAQAITLGYLPGIIEFINKTTEATRAAGGFANFLTSNISLSDFDKLDEKLVEFEGKLGKIVEEREAIEKSLANSVPLLRSLPLLGTAGDLADLAKQEASVRSALKTFRSAKSERDQKSTRESILAFTGEGRTALVAQAPVKKEKSGKSEAEKQAEKIKTFVEALEKERAALGLSETQIKLYEAAKLGMSGASLKNIESLAGEIQAYKENETARERVRQSSAEYIDNQLEAGIATRKLIEEISFETAQIGRSATQREIAINLRNLETSAIDTSTESYRKLYAEVERVTQAKADVQLIQDKRGSVDKLAKDLSELDEFLERNPGEWDTYAEGFFDRMEEMQVAARETKTELSSELSAVGIAIQNIASDASAAFVEILFSGENTFKRLVETALKELARLVIYQAILGPLAAGISGGISGVGFGAGMASFRTGAGGGNVSAGQRYLVGEEGPEWLVPRHDGAIIPNNEIRNSGGNSITVVVNSGRDTQQRGNGSNQNLSQFARQMGALMDAKLIEAQRPGGLLA